MWRDFFLNFSSGLFGFFIFVFRVFLFCFFGFVVFWVFLVCVSLYIIKAGVNLELMQFLEYTVYILKTQARLVATVKLSHLIS